MHPQEPPQHHQRQGTKLKLLQGLAPKQLPAQQWPASSRTSPTAHHMAGSSPAAASPLGLRLQQQAAQLQQLQQQGAALQQTVQSLGAPSPRQHEALRLPAAAAQQAGAALRAPTPADAAGIPFDSAPPAKRRKAAQNSPAHSLASQAHAPAQDSSAGSEHFSTAQGRPAATAAAAAAAGVDGLGLAATTSSRRPRAASLKAKALISEDAQRQRVKPEWLTKDVFYSPGSSPTQGSTAGPPAAAARSSAVAVAASVDTGVGSDGGVPSAAAVIAVTAANFTAVAAEVLDVAGRALLAVAGEASPQQQQQWEQNVLYDLKQPGQQDEQQRYGYGRAHDSQQQDFDFVKQEVDYAADQQQQQQQQKPPVDLNDQYKVWPDLDPSPDNSTDFDLIPSSLCSPGVQPLMSLLIRSTQRKSAKSEPTAANDRAQEGRCGRRQSTGSARAARGSKGSRGRGHAGDSATAAAADLLAGGFPRASGLGYSGSATGADSGRYYDLDDGWQYSQQQYSQQSDQQYGQGGFDEDLVAASQEDYAAAAAAGDDEEAWYDAAEAAGSTFNWHNAPCGRFYRVSYKRNGVYAVASLIPEKVVTRQSFQDELWNIGKRTRVAPVTDPCHPCMHNAVRPATMPPSQHLKLEANKDLAADSLLGIYHGDIVTMQEDQQKNCADLTCTYGLQHAYNMTATSVTDSELACPIDHTPLEIMVVGDSKRCRLCLINDVMYWSKEMEDQGWGPCLQAAKGTCNCSDYKVDTEESKQAAINVIWKHYMYRALNGDYIPAIAAYTSKEVLEGRELLTTYEQGNDGFWDAIRMNLAQFCYVQSLAKKSKGPMDALEKILGLVKDQPKNSSSSSAVLQQIQQLAVAGLQSAQQEDHNLSVLLQEARAMQMKESIPAQVAEARRRTVASYLQQQ